ncbi:MAG: TIGR00725 family protein [Ferroplasma sp.]
MFSYYIGVIGGSIASQESCRSAYEVGKLLASNSCLVFCGGNGGIMECASRGVSDNGGTVIGILPGEDRKAGNKYLTIAIPTQIGYLRNFLIIRACDALIAIDGYTGTTSEASFALTEGKSVVSIGELNIRTKDGDGRLFHASSPEEAVKIALKEADKYNKKF